MHHLIDGEIQKLSATLALIKADQDLLQRVNLAANVMCDALRQGRKVLFAGNGGSAADSQHLAAELVSRLRYNRPGLAGIALTTDTSALTAIGNDYSFETIFSRQVESIGQAGDIFVGISTSGKSPNILKAFEAAKENGMYALGLTGADAPLMTNRCDLVLNVPSKETPKIQECHIMFGHIICAIVEDELFGAEYDPMRQKTEAVA